MGSGFIFLLMLWLGLVLPASGASKPLTRPEAAAKRPVIAAYGDSLTAGYGVETGKSYPDYLQQELDRRGYRYQVVNVGISGETTSGGLARVDKVLALKPSIAVLELGGNDGLRGIDPAMIKANLEKIIQTLQKANIKVVLAGMTLPPNYGPEYVHSFEQIYVDLATKYHVPRVRFLLEGVYNGGTGMMQNDGIHATAKGNQVVAKNILATLEPMLRK